MNDCSSFLEGKEELGVEKALLRVGLSASWDIVGEADMAGACVSKRGHGEQGTGNGGWRQFLEKLFPDSRMGGRVVYMVKQAVDGRR